MAIVNQKYNGAKINLLHQVLQSDAEEGRPREYDIVVDDLKVVRRTTDPDKFFLHEDFISGDTKTVIITIYEGTSKRNTRYFFALKEGAEEDKATLSGLENVMNDKMLQQRREWEHEQLQKELAELKEEMDEQEAYIEKLEGMLQEEKGKKASIKDSWGDVMSVALEGMVRRNSHLLGGIPMIGQGLAGVIEQDNKRLEDTQANSSQAIEERKVTFQKVGEREGVASTLFPSKEDQETLTYFRTLKETFSEAELMQVLEIIGMLSYNKESIASVVELLKEGDEPDTPDDEMDDTKDRANSF